jgi:hypothetical protein
MASQPAQALRLAVRSVGTVPRWPPSIDIHAGEAGVIVFRPEKGPSSRGRSAPKRSFSGQVGSRKALGLDRHAGGRDGREKSEAYFV